MTTDDQAREIISRNVKYWMDVRGLSQAQLAVITGESEARISNLRHGTKNSQGPFLIRVAEALGLTPNDLMLPRETRQKGHRKKRSTVTGIAISQE